jgi:cell division protein FtsA
MAKDKIINVIDLGSSKIATCAVSVNEDSNPSIIGVASFSSKGFKRGQIVDIESVISSLTQCVEAAERMAGINIGSAYVSVGSVNLNSRNSRGVVAVADPNSEITKDDIERVIDAARAVTLPPSYEVIHVIPRDFIVDGQSGIRDPKGMMGIRLEVDTHIVIESLPNIRNILKAMKELGIEVEKFVFCGLASSLAVLSDTEKDLGVILLDIGSGKTDMAVWIDGSLTYSAVLPVAGLHVTKDIALGLRVSLESAEKIKLFLTDKYAVVDEETRKKESYKDEIDIRELNLPENITKVSKKTLIDGIIKPRLTEIFGLAAAELEKQSLLNMTPAGIVLTGGGALTHGIVDVARNKMALPVRVGVPYPMSGLTDEIQNPPYATSAGLISFAIAEEKIGKKHGKSGLEMVKKFPAGNIIRSTLKFFKNFLP